MKCRHCNAGIASALIDLRSAPHSNYYLEQKELLNKEVYFPLKVLVCESCWLAQTIDYHNASEIFSENYAYFSSISKSFLTHASAYVDQITDELKLGNNSLVVEIASNDGYLLRNFIPKDIPCFGIEPTKSTASEARKLGLDVVEEFFGSELAKRLKGEGKKASLIIGNNVYAHVPDINDFTLGMKELLATQGTITLEFPHILNLIKNGQFDTIYHEHFSYFSFTAVQNIFNKFDLNIYKVEKIPTHGGSLRVYGSHAMDSFPIDSSVEKMNKEEFNFGISEIETYTNFQTKADQIKNDLIDFLITERKKGKKIVAYGAASKGNTFLNYAGIKSDLVEVIFDAAASKQNRFAPGSHIPILSPEKIINFKFDYMLVLPWNIFEEVLKEFAELRKEGVKFVRAIPALEVI